MRVEFVDQTLRDGQQSWWGMRMRHGVMLPIAREIDRAGFRVVDLTGSSLFEVLLRYNREDPWTGLDLVKGQFPRSRLRAGTRSNCIAKFGLTPDSLMELWVRTLVKHGIGSFWIYDCLFNMDKMQRMAAVAADAGAEVVPSVMYGLSPVHTDEFYAEVVRQMVSWGTADAIYVEDAPGILTPERAATLIPALVEAAGEVPLELHCHNTTGLAPLNYLQGLKSGVSIIHTASQPLANGPSLPSTEAMLDNVQRLGHSADLDEAALPLIARYFERVAKQEGHPIGVPNEYSVFNYQHQLPGGMTGTLKAQLAQYGMAHRLQEVLEEIVPVREDLGHPVSATPFSQLMGIQAVLNVVTGERYGVVPDEVIIYVLGHLGTPPAPIDEDVKDRILSSPRGRELSGWEPPQPSLDELRRDYGDPKMSDEELLLRYLVPAEDIEATRAAGPIATTYELFDDTSVASFVCDLLGRANRNFVQAERPGLSVTLRRRPRP